MSGTPPATPVDALREELRRLGYLEAPLDRFVLGGAAPASPVIASARTGVRVMLAGGVLFGLALTLVAVMLDPHLADEGADVAVLAGYFSLGAALLIGLVTAAAGFVAGWSARAGFRPGRALARNVGLAFGLTWLACLALWWRSHAAGAPRALQVAIVVVGLGLGLALGRFGALAVVAVLSAVGMGDRLPTASLTRRHMGPLLAGGVALFAAGLALASASVREEAGTPDFAVVPTGARVRVLGVDGLEHALAVRLAERGAMPALARLLAEGAHGALAVEPQGVPALVWTTIATGRGPEAHGVQATGTRRLAGMRRGVGVDAPGPVARALGTAADFLRLSHAQPATAVLRDVKAFWNVAADKGLRVGVVNWWATWPADGLDGYVVSDRTLFRLEKGGPGEREVHPPAVLERLRSLPALAETNRARRIDAFAAAASAVLRGDHPPDLEAVYLPGLDIAAWQRLGATETLDASALDAQLHALREHYAFVDRLLGEALAGRGADEVLVLVGDPGRVARRGPSAQGLLALLGPGVARTRLAAPTERDLAPTVLHLLGLPVSRELPGRALEEALTEAFRLAHPVREVAHYGRRPPRPAAQSAFDREVLEELRSLGYVQ